MENDSTLTSKGPCPHCGSSDAYASYDDGHRFCFSCQTYDHPEDGHEPSEERQPSVVGLLPLGEVRALPSRKLTLETCQKWDYTVSTLKGETVQLANYYDPVTRRLVKQKSRTKDKVFAQHGDTKADVLYGQWLWRAGGKRIVITEGELDALSVSQVMDNKWPVVSLPNGVQQGRKALAKALDYLLTFDAIILCIDMDEPGREHLEEMALVFPPGRVFVASLPLKDASDMVVAGRGKELLQCLWDAKPYRPDGIVSISDIVDDVLVDPPRDLSWCFPGLDEATLGRRYGECVGFGAGTGVGKTTFITQQLEHDLRQGHPSAIFAFEATPTEIVRRIAGVREGCIFHIPEGEPVVESEETSWGQVIERTKRPLSEKQREGLMRATRAIQHGAPLYLYNHFGACNWSVVKERIRYLRHCNGVRVFWIDHLTALAAAEEDERKGLERIMSELAGLVKELSIWIGFVSHLATPDGKPHEEGGRVMIRHFKGSRAIGYWAHDLVGLERNQQPDPEDDDYDPDAPTIYRLLKCRWNGSATGTTIPVAYEPSTGRLVEAKNAAPRGMFKDETLTGNEPF